MVKVFGNSKIYSGVVSVLKAQLDHTITKTKTPWKLLRDRLFAPGYITTHILTDTIREGRMVCKNLLLLTQTSLGLTSNIFKGRSSSHFT